MRATSVSIFCRPPRPWPPWRRARSRRRSSSEISRPAGRPSITTVSCGPWDSPEVRNRITQAMIGPLGRPLEVALVDDLLRSSRPGDEARTISTEAKIMVGADELIAGCLNRRGLPPDPPTISRIRRAMAIPVDERFQPLPGAGELLRSIRELGMRNVIASNTYWRDADSYWDDFRHLGMAGDIDGIVTSVDAGHLKPHPAVFEMAMRQAGVSADRCVVIGNREENDVAPALA